MLRALFACARPGLIHPRCLSPKRNTLSSASRLSGSRFHGRVHQVRLRATAACIALLQPLGLCVLSRASRINLDEHLKTLVPVCACAAVPVICSRWALERPCKSPCFLCAQQLKPPEKLPPRADALNSVPEAGLTAAASALQSLKNFLGRPIAAYAPKKEVYIQKPLFQNLPKPPPPPSRPAVRPTRPPEADDVLSDELLASLPLDGFAPVPSSNGHQHSVVTSAFDSEDVSDAVLAALDLNVGHTAAVYKPSLSAPAAPRPPAAAGSGGVT